MIELDQRVVNGLHEIAERAPVDADVWPDAELYVAKHGRQRHVLAGAVVAVVVVAAGAVSVGVVHEGRAKPALGSDPTPTLPGSALSATGPVRGSLTIVAGPAGRLAFAPSNLSLKTGVYAVTLTDGVDTTHTLRFGDPSTLATDLEVSAAGDKATTRVFFGRPGEYTFFCVMPGHRIAGMSGTVTVTGPAVTLADAEAAAARAG